ncbi:MAG: GlxA family transcriptional regulator, partial [Pseudomonadota bacterium]
MTNAKRAWVAEIGLLIYPDCQMSAIHGLTDLFRIAGEWAECDETRRIRVSHWRSDADQAPSCV